MSKFDDPQPEECECCMWKTAGLVKTDAYARTPGHGPFTPDNDKQWAWMCDVCRSTFIGNGYLYPGHYEPFVVLQTIGWGINAILAAIDKRGAAG